MVVIFMPFLPNLAVFLGISVWYLVPTYWIVVIYRFIESNLAIWQKNLEKAFLLLSSQWNLVLFSTPPKIPAQQVFLVLTISQ